MPLPQDEPIATSAVEPLVEAIPGPAVHLRAAGVSLVLVARDDALPSVLHWGHDLGDLTAEELAALAVAGTPGTVPNDLDDPTPYGALLPEHSSGWNGRPGLAGSRSGRGWSPRFALTGFQATADPAGGGRVVATGADETAGLTVTIEVELLPSGLVRQRASVTSTAGSERAGETYAVDGLVLTAAGAAGGHRAARPRRAVGPRAVPAAAAVRGGRALAGEPARPHRPRRAADPRGRHRRLRLRAGARCGRCTSPGAATTSPTPSGCRPASPCSAAASCCCPARSRSRRGRAYTSPWVYAAYGIGLDGAGRRASTLICAPVRTTRAARGRSCSTPGRRSTSTTTSTGSPSSPTRAAEVGVERFVLDDGWFRAPPRRHRRARRLVRRRGRLAGRPAPAGRPRPRARHGVRAVGRAGDGQPRLRPRPRPPRLDPAAPAAGLPPAVAQPAGARPRPPRGLRLHPRTARRAARPSTPSPTSSGTTTATCVDAGRSPDGAARRARADRSPFYRLLDELRAPPPRASRSSRARPAARRVDLGILERTDRVWASDSIDPLERQQIQRWTAQLLPPELLGSHVGAAAVAHHRTDPRPRLPRRHRAVRPVRHRVGPHGSLGDRAQGAGLVGGALQGACASCCTPARSSAPRSTTRRSPCTASSPPTAPTRCSRWCS